MYQPWEVLRIHIVLIMVVAGTSASAPVVAGIIAQLNDIRLQKGKSSLGFLNPLLYANPECFNDVNDGSNNACDGSYGFKAVNGW